MIVEKVRNYIDSNDMLNRGDKVIVAVSGGPDSMCLLHILIQIRELYNIEIHAAHVNHCLRGHEADKDEEYVKEFCLKHNIRFHNKRADINKYAEEHGVSSEMAGREVRYNFFNWLLKELNAQKIALAHNANDQAETVLMRLMRGTGLEGLRGIKAVRDSVFIRPVLVLSRHEIENYCEEYGIHPRIDHTNLENIYSRNKIRLELIPYIQDNFNPDIISTLNRFTTLMDKDNEFLESYAAEKFEEYCFKEKDRLIIHGDAFKEKEAIITRIIRAAINMIRGNVYNFQSVHIYDIINLSQLGTGKRIELPGNLVAENVYGEIHIYNVSKNKEKQNIQESKLKLFDKREGINDNIRKGIQCDIPELCVSVELKLKDRENVKNFKGDNLIKYFDYDKMKGMIYIRTRKEGDRFTPLGMAGSKKIKDLLIDLKVPKEERNRIPLLCDDDNIAWIVGYKVSDKFKVDKESNNILEVKIKERTKE